MKAEMKTTCRCRICKRSAKFNRIVEKLPEKDKLFMRGVEMDLMNAEDDAAFYIGKHRTSAKPIEEFKHER